MTSRTLSCVGMWLLLAAGSPAWGQTNEIAGFAGFRFGGGVTDVITRAQIDINGGVGFGGALAIGLGEDSKVEALVTTSTTRLDTSVGDRDERLNLRVDYYHLGLIQEVDADALQPFAGVSAGITRFSPETGDAESGTRFSIGAVLGGKYFFSRNVGLRVDGRVFLTFVDDAAGIFCGEGPIEGECSFTYGGNSLWQGEATAGLVIAF